jgi:hypothetical protein
MINLTVPTALDITLCRSGTNYDTKLEIFKENGTSTGNFNDDDYTCSANMLRSVIKNAALAPGRYFIVVDGYNGAVGNYDMQVAVSTGLAKEVAVSIGLSKSAAKTAFEYEATKRNLTEKPSAFDMQAEYLVYELEKVMNGGNAVIPTGVIGYLEDGKNQGKMNLFPNKISIESSGLANGLMRFGLPADGNVEISLYALNGAKIQTIVKGWMAAGYHSIAYGKDKTQMGRQICICRVVMNGTAIERKMPIVR